MKKILYYILVILFVTGSWQQKFYEQTVGKLKPQVLIPLHRDNFFQPLSENLVMLPRFLKSSSEGFDFMIEKSQGRQD